MAEESFAAGLVGVVLDGRYRLDALLGEGGMGAVFRAHHLAMDRKVAVKLLKPHLTTDEAALQRFAREARSTMRVDSEHAVKVLDFGVTPHRDYYMVLEYLDGRTVQRELDVDGPFEPARVVHIAKQACAALGAAHRSGLIHRDVKPDNVLLMRVGDDPDYVKILDFGVAKLMDGAARSDRSQLAITQLGMVFGTPEFMSPEQACGQPLDGRSDLYSLAATMFAMLTGCGMYRASTAIDWLTHHARTPPPHLADGAPALERYTELDAVLQRCLAKHREARPETGEQMAHLLATIEHTLVKGRAPLPAMRGPTFSPSSYVAALDLDQASGLGPQAGLQASGLGPRAGLQTSGLGSQAGLQAPGLGSQASAGRLGSNRSNALAETLKPGDGVMLPASQASLRASLPSSPRSIGTSSLPPSTSDAVESIRRSRRGMWLVLGALVLAGMIVTAITIATRKRESSSTPVAKPANKRIDAVVAIANEPLPNAANVDAAGAAGAGTTVVGAGLPAGRAPEPEGGSEARGPRPEARAPEARAPEARGPRPEARAPEARAREVSKLIAEAEQAKRTRNLVRWVIKADAAFQLEPRNLRARFLLADGLIASGDLERGCKYLRELSRMDVARARATQAGCPVD